MKISQPARLQMFCKLFFPLSLILVIAISANARERISFNQQWKFRLDTANASAVNVNDAGWRTLSVPHDWSIEGEFSEKHPASPGGGALPGGTGWYRKAFTIPLTDQKKKISIEFDGVYCNSDVWINGFHVGNRPNGYISFSYDLTPYLKYGNEKNIIAVKVNNSHQPNSRWYSGSGIFRNVWLVSTNAIHIPQFGSFISTPNVSKSNAEVHVETKIANASGKEETVEIFTTLYDNNGKPVASQKVSKLLPVSDTTIVAQNITVKNPMLWATEKPGLYKSVTQVKLNGRIADEYSTNFGIRYFNFDEKTGFTLNGKPLKILGVCNHHDLGCLGSAFNTRAAERQLEILKAMGCNGIRTSHNPPAPELLDLCDKMGFIVMDEAFDMWAKSKNPYDYHLAWDEWHKKDLEALIRRDRNHPSIFMWSVGNEIGEQWGNAEKGDTAGRNIARQLVKIVKSLDTSRPIVTANNEPGKGNNLIQSGAFNLIGYNYHHQQWADFGKDWPGKKLVVTESVSALETRGQYDLVSIDSIRRWPPSWDKNMNEDGNKNFSVSAYDHVSAPWGSTHEESWKVLKNTPLVSGMYIWTGFDYLGEPTPYTWPARSSYFGVVDLAGFPKNVYYMYKSEWTNKPVLHLYPHWNWHKGETVDMVAYYNNADEVELFVNGKSLGSQSKNDSVFHVKWRVPFEAGVVKAVSKKNGKVVLTDEVKTAGEPAKILLSADRNKIKADGTDLSFVTVKVVDANGVAVPDADNLVKFTITGAGSLAGVDNGDPTSHTSFKASERKAFHALCLAILKSNGKKGSIALTATAEGLKPASIVVTAQ